MFEDKRNLPCPPTGEGIGRVIGEEQGDGSVPVAPHVNDCVEPHRCPLTFVQD